MVARQVVVGIDNRDHEHVHARANNHGNGMQARQSRAQAHQEEPGAAQGVVALGQARLINHRVREEQKDDAQQSVGHVEGPILEEEERGEKGNERNSLGNATGNAFRCLFLYNFHLA